MQFDDDDFLIAIEKNNLTRLKKMYEAGARPQDIGRGVDSSSCCRRMGSIGYPGMAS